MCLFLSIGILDDHIKNIFTFEKFIYLTLMKFISIINYLHLKKFISFSLKLVHIEINWNERVGRGEVREDSEYDKFEVVKRGY